jgi:hypothetical protein
VQRVIIDIGGKVETIYVWGLVNSTNNQVDAYALFLSLCVNVNFRIKSLIVIGYSSTIIKLMDSKSTIVDKKL